MISLIVHGGAWDIPDNLLDAHRKGCAAALGIGWNLLQKGGSAVDAVEQVIRFLEDDEAFDAGRGSHLNADGEVELDASVMNGETLRCGAVAAVHRIRNPISLARKIMDESEHIFLVGTGAERFAAEHQIPTCDPRELIAPREEELWKSIRNKGRFSAKDAFYKRAGGDTVGAVALDREGTICVGTSTGGTLNKYPGRVGDSPLIGCGSYADNAVGGISTTGWGEAIIKVVLAKTVIGLLELNGGNTQQAADRGVELLRSKADGYGGVIVLNARGECSVAFNTPKMARAYMTSQMKEPFVAV
ncbi:MAG TPA: isoaspartyl peptidase/L-asparaginase [Bacteroidota bacterium]|nr:isoaspartyl peptidase/L-asparaginase [Bacteroidota bacterium]